MLLLGAFFIMVSYSNARAKNIFELQNDSTSDTLQKPFKYVRIGIDLSKVIRSQVQKGVNVYEFQIDANLFKATSVVGEFGFGNSDVENKFLKYNSQNTFVRIGVDKYFFSKEFTGDMDNAFVGLRYALSKVSRSDAIWTIYDPVWGNTQSSVPSAAFVAHWIELTGGMRLEIIKNVFAGWNVRVKTFMNPKKFELLPPAYLAGFGAGDKNTAFDFNFYLLYGIGKRK